MQLLRKFVAGGIYLYFHHLANTLPEDQSSATLLPLTAKSGEVARLRSGDAASFAKDSFSSSCRNTLMCLCTVSAKTIDWVSVCTVCSEMSQRVKETEGMLIRGQVSCHA